MPQLLSRVRTRTNDKDTALEQTAKTAPTVHHRVAPQATHPTPGEKSPNKWYPCMQGKDKAAVSAYSQYYCEAHLTVGLP